MRIRVFLGLVVVFLVSVGAVYAGEENFYASSEIKGRSPCAYSDYFGDIDHDGTPNWKDGWVNFPRDIVELDRDYNGTPDIYEQGKSPEGSVRLGGDDDGLDGARIEPKYFDAVPNDGMLDPGTRSNPYILRDSKGNKYELVPKYGDNPKDGISDPGTSLNPYVIKRKR